MKGPNSKVARTIIAVKLLTLIRHYLPSEY